VSRAQFFAAMSAYFGTPQYWLSDDEMEHVWAWFEECGLLVGGLLVAPDPELFMSAQRTLRGLWMVTRPSGVVG